MSNPAARAWAQMESQTRRALLYNVGSLVGETYHHCDKVFTALPTLFQDRLNQSWTAHQLWGSVNEKN